MKMHLDRRWGNGLTTAVFIMALAGALTAFAATPAPQDNPASVKIDEQATPYSEVSATADEVVAGSTSAVVPLATNALMGSAIDSATTGTRILMDATVTHDSAFTGATGLLFTELTANMGGSTDAGFATSTSAASSTATTPTWEVWRGSAPNHSVGNSFGHTQ